MENKKKRFYKVGEIVWVVDQKKEGKVLSINRDEKTATVQVDNEELVLEFWKIDKLKYKAKEKLVKEKKKAKSIPTIYFAKVREGAVVPSKRTEDAGYDIYAHIESKTIDGKEVCEIFCPAFKTTLVPTGIAMALPDTHYFNVKHERGSTGKISMSVLAGVVDSGYRGEIFVAITPLNKDVVITSEVLNVEETDELILYPYSKAIAQGTVDLVPKVHIEEISFEDLKKMSSERGDTKLGQSGK
ncbi:dUTP diphosphatase [Bacillus subtilis]|uniref:dUTP diphosphatase n=2 Tax=Zhangjivirus TaxID=3044867 RepID=A0AAE9K603_9CAUD|nr:MULTISPECIES: dUTP diphosphatase [Bacillus subtilis group]YP_010681719.1 dUTPase [Bacillus phage vB_BsuS_PJN02]YP_010740227.1 deoxyuridine 5'-triphosphate nucleotidohydrolase [Bacillus phage FADO]MCR4362027.1 dUTP diphosphatase [Bacillus subtilis]UNH58444.1 dUTPase [Bacillus phage vB_BsuS_PJN02]UNY48925.1 deoxyuridine 5'-triphosphate nucleotidohydrolase [Bacillus phage FADO]UQB84356.1 dUTP diphosphatase [Bacillus amyloliquefaciens]WOF32994.1 dUTP diphosphatase [Bacillus subtilis]